MYTQRTGLRSRSQHSPRQRRSSSLLGRDTTPSESSIATHAIGGESSTDSTPFPTLALATFATPAPFALTDPDRSGSAHSANTDAIRRGGERVVWRREPRRYSVWGSTVVEPILRETQHRRDCAQRAPFARVKPARKITQNVRRSLRRAVRACLPATVGEVQQAPAQHRARRTEVAVVSSLEASVHSVGNKYPSGEDGQERILRSTGVPSATPTGWRYDQQAARQHTKWTKLTYLDRLFATDGIPETSLQERAQPCRSRALDLQHQQQSSHLAAPRKSRLTGCGRRHCKEVAMPDNNSPLVHARPCSTYCLLNTAAVTWEKEEKTSRRSASCKLNMLQQGHSPSTGRPGRRLTGNSSDEHSTQRAAEVDDGECQGPAWGHGLGLLGLGRAYVRTRGVAASHIGRRRHARHRTESRVASELFLGSGTPQALSVNLKLRKLPTPVQDRSRRGSVTGGVLQLETPGFVSDATLCAAASFSGDSLGLKFEGNTCGRIASAESQILDWEQGAEGTTVSPGVALRYAAASSGRSRLYPDGVRRSRLLRRVHHCRSDLNLPMQPKVRLGSSRITDRGQCARWQLPFLGYPADTAMAKIEFQMDWIHDASIYAWETGQKAESSPTGSELEIVPHKTECLGAHSESHLRAYGGAYYAYCGGPIFEGALPVTFAPSDTQGPDTHLDSDSGSFPGLFHALILHRHDTA
ncbi:hypothetical protein C8T65DRAFT_731401 [Cerioporus squamosus]|nr:hypothetical protein C8T65DRAFT_731401 [Cerioporus squamosus]